VVYVDNMNTPNGDWIMCNMVADTASELYSLADAIGLKREWVKNDRYRREHFEITLTKKKAAIKEGAKEVSVLELMILFPAPVTIPDKELNLAELHVRYLDSNSSPDFKDADSISAKVGELVYRIPWYCLTDFLWGMPDDFYPCDKYEWADHPLYLTSIEMVKTAIAANPSKFVAFILYSNFTV